jgi:(p)ppGpp synthase/HD superfamily hydrolase
MVSIFSSSDSMENYHNWLLEGKTSLLKLVENTFLPKQVTLHDIKIFEEDFLRISLAFDSAAECHQDELRDSGEPYFTHPVSVARILLQQFQGVNINQIILALTHDTIESKPHFQEIINRKL